MERVGAYKKVLQEYSWRNHALHVVITDSENVTLSWTRNWAIPQPFTTGGPGLRHPIPSSVMFHSFSYLLSCSKWSESMKKTNQPTNSLCLHPIKGYQIPSNYIGTSALRNICGGGSGQLGEKKEVCHRCLPCSFALPFWSYHTIRGSILGRTGTSFHLLQPLSCL